MDDYMKDIVKNIQLANRTDGMDSVAFSVQAIAECLYLMLTKEENHNEQKTSTEGSRTDD